MVGKTPFDCYHVNKIKVKDKRGTTKDQLEVVKAGLRLDPPHSVNMETDMVQLRMDGLTFDFSIGSFVEKKPGDWQYKSATGSKPSYSMRIDFNKDVWSFEMKDGNVALIDESDGVDVALMINGFESSENVAIASGSHGHGSGGSHSGDFGNRHNSCRLPTGTHGGGSDSGSPGKGKLSCISSITVQHIPSGELITKTRVDGTLFHPATPFVSTDTGAMETYHTSCSKALRCGDHGESNNPDFIIVEIQGLPGDKLAQRCGVVDASCKILP